MNIEQTAPGGGLTLTCEVIAQRSKQTTRTLILGAPGTAQSNRKRPWRRALFWAVAELVNGSHDADLIANVDGSMVSIACTGASGAINPANKKVALASSFYSQVPNPTAIIWKEVDPGGVSNPNIIMVGGEG